VGKKMLGFGADVATEKEKQQREILAEVQPEDLLRFGLIPEFIGRLPVIATLDELDEGALVRILMEPKNALVKQYQKLFHFENVKLEFTDDALRAVAREAMKRKSGARGLRSILEHIMLDLMYDIPSRPNTRECMITEESVLQKGLPLLIYEDQVESA
jgi:ATP-dependent Clp protease ATP-binding subunit ClpX